MKAAVYPKPNRKEHCILLVFKTASLVDIQNYIYSIYRCIYTVYIVVYIQNCDVFVPPAGGSTAQ